MEADEFKEDEIKNLFAEISETFKKAVAKYREAMDKSFSDYQKMTSEIETERKRKIEEALKLL